MNAKNVFFQLNHVLIVAVMTLTACQDDDPVPVRKQEYTYIFYTSLGDRTIERLTLEGDQVIASEILYNSLKGLDAPSALVADEVAEMIYWTDFSTRQLLRAPWDGNGNPEVLYTVPPDANGPVELTLDPVAQRLFWTQPLDDLILSAPANGSGPVDTLFQAQDGVNGAWGISLRIAEGFLYWVEYLDIEVYRARTDGTQAMRLFAGGSGFLKPYGLAISAATQELFIVDNPVPGAGQPDRILKGSLDGNSNLETVYSLEDGVNNAYNVVVDEKTGHLYWHNQLTNGGIWRGSMDGTQAPVNLINNINVGQGLAIAKHKVSIATPL